MATDPWVLIRTLFLDVRALEPSERGPFLERHCSDPRLRRTVLDMLVAEETGPLAVEHKLLTSDEPEGAESPPGSSESTIGSYRVIRLLGRGGSADTYLASPLGKESASPVALKLLRGSSGPSEPMARLRQEAGVLARLDHPGIAAVLGQGKTADGRAFLIMEFVEGRPLLEHVQGAALGLSARLALFLDVCAAVQHAHDHRILHRDLKSTNILVTMEGRAVIVDFGIAKVLDPAGGVVTPAGVRLLTPANAAPEQITGGPPSTGTDIYALGLLLYELVTGVAPLSTAGLNWLEWERRVLDEEPRPPSETLVSDVDPSVRAAVRATLDGPILRCLRKKPAERYGSVRDVMSAVRRGRALLDGLEQPEVG